MIEGQEQNEHWLSSSGLIHRLIDGNPYQMACQQPPSDRRAFLPWVRTVKATLPENIADTLIVMELSGKKGNKKTNVRGVCQVCWPPDPMIVGVL
jgi:hypothetical protein